MFVPGLIVGIVETFLVMSWPMCVCTYFMYEFLRANLTTKMRPTTSTILRATKICIKEFNVIRKTGRAIRNSCTFRNNCIHLIGIMSEESTIDLSALQDEIDALAARITKQGAEVRQLKKDSASDADAIGKAVDALKELKIKHEELNKKMLDANGGKGNEFNRRVFDELVLRKMFVVPSFEIHGGVKGLFDLGPPACALKVSFHNLMNLVGLSFCKFQAE